MCPVGFEPVGDGLEAFGALIVCGADVFAAFAVIGSPHPVGLEVTGGSSGGVVCGDGAIGVWDEVIGEGGMSDEGHAECPREHDGGFWGNDFVGNGGLHCDVGDGGSSESVLHDVWRPVYAVSDFDAGLEEHVEPVFFFGFCLVDEESDDGFEGGTEAHDIGDSCAGDGE